jgi:hypothetical protein
MKWPIFIGICCFGVAISMSTAAEKKAVAMKIIEEKVIQKDIVMLASMPAASIAGSTIHLKLTVENKSKEDIMYYTRTKYFDYGLTLVDSKGKSVPLTKLGKIVYGDARRFGSRRVEILKAEKSMEVTITLSRVFDLSLEGEYTLTINRVVGDELKADKLIDLKIEKIVFKVDEEPR